MDVVIGLLIWIHFLALAAGGAAAFGMPVVGSRMPTATAETRPTLFAIMKGISTVGRAAIGTLVVTGPLIVWLKYGGFGTMPIWFWVKMVLVLLAGLNFLLFIFKVEPSLLRLGPHDATPMFAKAVGVASLVFWFGVLTYGRLLPYLGTGGG